MLSHYTLSRLENYANKTNKTCSVGEKRPLEKWEDSTQNIYNSQSHSSLFYLYEEQETN